MRFPDWMEGIHIGSMGACLVLSDIRTLRAGQDVKDEVIRAVLGLKMDEIKTKKKTDDYDSTARPHTNSQRPPVLGNVEIFRLRFWYLWSSGGDFEPKTRSVGAGFEYWRGVRGRSGERVLLLCRG